MTTFVHHSVRKGGCSPKNGQKMTFFGKIYRPKGGGGCNPRNPPPRSANECIHWYGMYMYKCTKVEHQILNPITVVLLWY